MKEINTFRFSDTNKRYHTYDYYLKNKYGKKCVRIPLDGGFTCPNIDGKCGHGGCIYCTLPLSPSPLRGKSLEEQFAIHSEILEKKWKNTAKIAYFNDYSGTYAPLSRLKELYEKALSLPGTVGLSVATRADCLNDEIIEYLHELSLRTDLTVELGLQTAHDRTARLINRCHERECFEKAFDSLSGIKRAVHIINGLPGEDEEMMLSTARYLSALRPEFLKIHMLYISRGTPAEKLYNEGKITEMTKERYAETVVSQLEIMPEETVIMRITGDGERDSLVYPLWSLKKFTVMNEVDKIFKRRESCQGAKFSASFCAKSTKERAEFLHLM